MRRTCLTAGKQTLKLAILIVGFSMCFGQTRAEPPAAAPLEKRSIEFNRDVQPVLRERCHKCHGGVQTKGGLSLLSREKALAVLPSDARAIVPGEPQSSELIRRITATDDAERMPPDDSLTAAEIDVLRRWIAEGATWELHWSFQPIRRFKIPPIGPRQSWVHNAIDRFVIVLLDAAAIKPSPEADRATLIRRLYLDLIGLLPTVADIDAFAGDSRPDAYERVVDRLLASPHFGERWGRHWLDQAHYADTDGYEVDSPRKSAWLWRDWVINALNADMPFDQFTLEQIAGDLIPNASASQKLATGFHRQSLTNREGGIDKEEARYRELVERVNSVATIWLGLTLGCAQCHDHPYDPLSQREFYELYAIFNQTDDVELPVNSQQTPIGAGSNSNSKKPESEGLSALVVSQSTEFRPTTMYLRGDFLQPGAVVQPKLFVDLQPSPPRTTPTEKTDRLSLARWIIHPDNPFMPRVAVNQVWIRLFGAGLVRTPDDFGSRGESPTHAELLDWLADEYRTHGWNTKQFIRRIVTSATYRQASAVRTEVHSVDPLNKLLHRQNRYRVEAELIHDLSFDAAGLLTAQIGGASYYPPLAEEITKLSFRSNYVWNASTGSDRYRRGLYVFYKRTLPHPNLDTFDCPDATVARMQRETSNTPLQALTSLNQEYYFESAQALGQRVLMANLAADPPRIEFLFRRCVGRLPNDDERQSLDAFLAEARRWYRGQPEEAEKLVGKFRCPGVEVSEPAAWVATSNIILNLDEFLTRE